MAEEEKSKSSKGPTLEWMYKPSALVDREDYLTGRSVDKSLKLLDEIEKGNNPSEFNYLNEVEKDLTPMSIFSSQGSGSIDIIKKIKDDPLYQIQKKEQESLKQLLQNPVKMKQLNKLIEAQQEATSSSKHKKKKSSKEKKHKRSKHRSNSSDYERRKHGSSEKRKQKRRSSSSDDSDIERSRKRTSRSRRSPSTDFDEREKQRKDIIEKFKRKAAERNKNIPERNVNRNPTSTKKLSEEELENKRKEMMENAKWRDEQRSKNVNKYREEGKKEEEKLLTQKDPDFIRKQLLEAASSGSVEQRVKSNSYNIQRSKSSMDQNFLKR